MHDAAGGTDEIGGGVPGDYEFAAQQVHTLDARGFMKEFLAFTDTVCDEFTFVE
jgi:hypothetical protein